MRIAYVITRGDAVGGASIHVRDLAGEMLARGHQVTVLLGGGGPVAEQLEAAGIPYRRLACLARAIHPVRDIQAYRELRAALASLRPDLVSAHTAKAGWIARAACASLRLPVSYTPHGWPAGERFAPLPAAAFAVAERLAARWTDAVICVCEYERRLALAKRLCPAGLLHVVYNGVRDVPPPLRAAPGDSPVRLISVARFEPPKDHATLIEALAGLRSLDWRLELVGDGPLENAVRERVRHAGIQDRVVFSGYLPDPAPALGRAQIFVLSSRSEAFPRSVLEAMRAGLAAVATEVGGVSEALDNERNGVLVPRGDAVSLRAALRGLIEDADRRRRLGAEARLAYQARFRLELMAARTIEIYESVLRNAAR